MFDTLLKSLNKKSFVIFSIVLMICILFYQSDKRYGYFFSPEKEITPIVSDGTGYYIYLPQYIVYPDSSNFSFHEHLNQRYSGKRFFEMLNQDPETKRASNKFYVGTALLQSPFYLIAHQIHRWTGNKADGYSLGYRFSIHIAALFYWLIGVIALFSLFTRLGFSRLSILIGIVAITFGTNLNYYTSYWVSMSHVYSFSMVACFLNFVQSWVSTNRLKDLLWAFLFIGLVAVIRPVNVLVLLIVPFFFNSFQVFLLRVKHLLTVKYVGLIAAMLLGTLPVFVHLSVQYDQYGQFILYSYGNEGFSNAFTPQIWNVLFSFHKGFFVYAPAMILSIAGLYFFYKRGDKYFFFGWIITLSLWIYAISAWWCWDYGGGLGMRAMIEMLPLFMFPLVYLFRFANRITTWIAGFVLLGGIFFYQLFQFQFNKDIIHYNEMNGKYFKYVFLKTDDRYRWMIDYDLIREKLPDLKLKGSVNVKLRNNSKWILPQNMDTTIIQTEIRENVHVLNYFPKSEDSDFMGELSGWIKLNNPECNPFLSIKYFKQEILIEESIFTIGSNIDNPYQFEKFGLEINHDLKAKNCSRIELSYGTGGCTSHFKNVNLTIY